MANKKVTVTYNGSTLLNEVELANSNIIYNGNTILSDGVYTNKKLNCANLFMVSDVKVCNGSTYKTLNCNGKYMLGDIIVTSANAGPSTTLNENGWDVINTYAAQGSSYWSVGDTKTGTYINNESHPYRIVQFNHSGDAGNITFEQVNLMTNLYAMKSSMTSSDSWANSDLKTTINNLTIDSTLSAVIKTASKPCATSVSSSTQTSVSSKLWVMSEKEMFNTTSYSICTTEGSLYTYYANGGSKVKHQYGWETSYWLRSAYNWLGDYSRFARVWDDGSVGFSVARYSLGVAPCFCI